VIDKTPISALGIVTDDSWIASMFTNVKGYLRLREILDVTEKTGSYEGYDVVAELISPEEVDPTQYRHLFVLTVGNSQLAGKTLVLRTNWKE
jgi:hypothetical protein